MKVMKIIGIIGSIIMIPIDIAYLVFCFKFIVLFFSGTAGKDFGSILFYTALGGIIPLFLMLGFGAVLWWITIFFLAPAIDF